MQKLKEKPKQPTLNTLKLWCHNCDLKKQHLITLPTYLPVDERGKGCFVKRDIKKV